MSSHVEPNDLLDDRGVNGLDWKMGVFRCHVFCHCLVVEVILVGDMELAGWHASVSRFGAPLDFSLNDFA